VTTDEARPSELEDGVRRSRSGFMSRLRGLLGGASVSAETWAEVEESLIAGDVGATLATTVVDQARAARGDDGATAAVRRELAALLLPRNPHWELVPARAAGGPPAVVLIVGVNGTGKTTTIGKLAAREAAAGRRIVLAAADTFRAAAAEQLRIWATRAGADIVAHAAGADPAAVVFDALDAAVARQADVVLVDTGQNGLIQAVAFHEAVKLTGIVLTKLDSTSRGGIVFSIEQRLGVPVRYAGVGERPEDLIAFDPAAFVDALFEDAA